MSPSETAAQEPAYLYPAGAPSADVLPQGDALVSPFGWASYGLTDDLTLTVDWLLALVAVPAGYVRYRLPDLGRLHTSLELYGIAFQAVSAITGDEQVKGVDRDGIPFYAWQKGAQAWLHLNTTVDVTTYLRWHTSVGATYDTYQRYEPREGAGFTEEMVATNYVYPDLATGLELRACSWLTLSANVLVGNSFYIFDQNPHKWMVQYSAKLAPFRSPSRHWLWRGLSVEMFGFYANLPALHYDVGGPPIFPLVMWQSPR